MQSMSSVDIRERYKMELVSWLRVRAKGKGSKVRCENNEWGPRYWMPDQSDTERV